MTRRYAGKKWQGEDERIAYSVDTTPWGGYDSDEVVTLLDGNGVSIPAHLIGAASVVGTTITTPVVEKLSRNIRYTLQIQWVVDGNTLEVYFYIFGEI